MSQPQLNTERLLLRPLHLDDAQRIQSLAGDKRVAEMTANIPHPYPDGAAIQWITPLALKWQQQDRATFGVSLQVSNELIGVISLSFKDAKTAELSYWIGVDYWAQGYATEAGQHIISFAFKNLGVEKVQARVLSRNPASGNVLLKCG
ncbi:MAG: GNAT family N-acetyltransferase, partial [Leucothrix sp.]